MPFAMSRARAVMRAGLLLVGALLLLGVPATASAGSSTVAAGYGVSCSVSGAGSLACWGSQKHGSLGTGLTEPAEQPTPQRVVGMESGVTEVAAGVPAWAAVSHVCAIQSGALKCWGPNQDGQLGNGTTIPSSTPVAVLGLQSGVTDVAVNGDRTCAVQSGAVLCWGRNFGPTPVAAGWPGSAANVANVELGAPDGFDAAHGCTVSTDGVLTCTRIGTGPQDWGQFALSGTTGVVDAATGDQLTCVVTTGGAALCAGLNNEGQTGRGGSSAGEPGNTPHPPVGMESGVAHIAAADRSACAIKTDGSVWCWGGNLHGQLGRVTFDGWSHVSNVPVKVEGLSAAAVAVSIERDHACAQLTDGTTWCWGYNGNGEIGLPPQQSGVAPRMVPQPTKAEPILLGPAKVVPKPAAKAVVKVAKPTAALTGGAVVKVTPTTTCTSLTVTSTFRQPATPTRSGAAGRSLGHAKATAPVHGMYLGGFGTPTVKLKGGGSVTLPKLVVPAVIPGQQVTMKVQPVVTAPKSSAKAVDPPKVPIQTKVACAVPKTTAALAPLPGLGGLPAATRTAFKPLVPTIIASTARTATPKPVTTTTTVNPPRTTPSPASNPAKLTPGQWSGKVDGTVSHAGRTVPAGEVSFTVGDDGVVRDFMLKGAERCVTPAGSRQGGSVTSQPWFTTIRLTREIKLSPASGFPRKGFTTFSSTKHPGTKSIKLGAGASQPGLTAHGTGSITGTVTATRTTTVAGHTAVVSCSMTATFSAKPGGTTVTEMNNGYTD
ncbi:MAG: RCC1 domain-containing protein [Thermoleophilia bacterium]